MSGPFESEAEVRQLPEVQAVYAAFDADPGPGKMAPHSQRMLENALLAAMVSPGAHDARLIRWLAGWGPQTVAVIASWITQAAAAGADSERQRAAVLEGVIARMPDAPALTDTDRTCISRARGLAAARGDDEMRAWFRSQDDKTAAAADPMFLLASGLGAAKAHLADMISIIERLTGHPYPETGGQS